MKVMARKVSSPFRLAVSLRERLPGRRRRRGHLQRQLESSAQQTRRVKILRPSANADVKQRALAGLFLESDPGILSVTHRGRQPPAGHHPRRVNQRRSEARVRCSLVRDELNRDEL